MNSRSGVAALLIVFACVFPVAAGEIQILCEPGLRIYLDGQFIGLSTEREDGLYLMDIEAGLRKIWVEKDGFLSQNFEIELGKYPAEITVGTFEQIPTPGPEPAVVAAPRAPVHLGGDLIVMSAPQNCTVVIDGETMTKDAPHMVVGGLAAGDHLVSFSKPGFKPVSRVVAIEPGADLRIQGNLKTGKVEIVHEGEGSLRVFSRPMVCSILFRGQVHDKTRQRLSISKIPAGEYPIAARWRGMELSSTIVIKKGRRTEVNIDFMDGEDSWVVTSEPE